MAYTSNNTPNTKSKKSYTDYITENNIADTAKKMSSTYKEPGK